MKVEELNELMKFFQGMATSLELSKLTKSSSLKSSLINNSESEPVVNEDSFAASPRSVSVEPASNLSEMRELNSVLIPSDTSSSGSPRSNGWTEDSRSECFSEDDILINSASSSRRLSFFKVSHEKTSESACVDNALVQ